jgi:hypothetical protein
LENCKRTKKNGNKMHYAITHLDNRIIAQGETFKECRDNADKTGLWGKAPGTAAPYFYTTKEDSGKEE